VIAIVGLGAYASTHSPFFLTHRNIDNLVQQISVLGVIAVGMTFLMVAGYLDLSVGTLASLIRCSARRWRSPGTASWRSCSSRSASGSEPGS